MTVRYATLKDLPILSSFNQAHAKSLGLCPAPTALGSIAAVLLDSTKGFYLVAETPDHNTPVCSVFVSLEWSDWYGGWYWCPTSLWVQPQYRKQGLATQLLKEILTRAHAKQNNVLGIKGYVGATNLSARSLYETLGAKNSGYVMYEMKV